MIGAQKKFTKQKLWDEYFVLNELESNIYIQHAVISTNKKEQEWVKYIQEQWSKGVNDNAKHLIYQIKIPYSNWEYIGETSIGMRKSARTHVGQTFQRAGRQKLYRKLRGLGIHKAIWFPIATWNEPCSKFERLREEAWHIWRRNCSLNALGTRSWDAQDRRQ